VGQPPIRKCDVKVLDLSLPLWPSPNPREPTSRFLYIRPFYPQLFTQCLKEKAVILLGNPGISKSFFHWYLLFRFVNDLSPNKTKTSSSENDTGSRSGDSDLSERQRPEVVVRQIGLSKFEVYFLQEEEIKVFQILKIDPEELLSSFNPETTIFLFEPQRSKLEPPDTGEIPIIITVSPDEIRYKEFAKEGATKLYMPCYEGFELMAIGAHISKEFPENTFIQEQFQMDKIQERIKRFGGIFRHVLSLRRPKLKEAELAQISAIEGLKGNLPLLYRLHGWTPEVGQTISVSHFLVQYRIKYEVVECEGGNEKIRKYAEDCFHSPSSQIASEYVEDGIFKIVSGLSDQTWFELLHALQELFLDVPRMQNNPKLFEFVIETILTNKAKRIPMVWKKCGENGEKEEVDWEKQFPITSKERWEKQSNIRQIIQPGVLYVPRSPSYPAVDMFVKIGEIIYGFQVTISQNHAKDKTVYQAWFKTIGITKNDQIKVIFCVNPEYFSIFADRPKESFLGDKEWRVKNEGALKDSSSVTNKKEQNVRLENKALARSSFESEFWNLEFWVMGPKSGSYSPQKGRSIE